MTEEGKTLWSSVRTERIGRGRGATETGVTPATGAAPADDGSDPGFEALSREQVVDQILSLNPSASSTFLEQFEARQLGMYLRHLLSAQEPRGPMARWRRPNDAPAIMWGRRRG
ncbi:MAG: hypothetical protein ACF8Q5_09200 [Phycisphaerales bacterium JB040]